MTLSDHVYCSMLGCWCEALIFQEQDKGEIEIVLTTCCVQLCVGPCSHEEDGLV